MTSSLTKAHPSIDALLAAEPIIEPDGPLRFGSRRGRDEHVRKHVLAARDERWRHLLGQDLISAALSNGREAGCCVGWCVCGWCEVLHSFKVRPGQVRGGIPRAGKGREAAWCVWVVVHLFV